MSVFYLSYCLGNNNDIFLQGRCVVLAKEYMREDFVESFISPEGAAVLSLVIWQGSMDTPLYRPTEGSS